MKKVRIADLKARLSAHLRSVRAGRTIVVLDRDTPIARIVPYREEKAALVVRPPLPGAPPLRDFVPSPPLDLGIDIVDVLLEERQNER